MPYIYFMKATVGSWKLNIFLNFCSQQFILASLYWIMYQESVQDCPIPLDMFTTLVSHISNAKYCLNSCDCILAWRILHYIIFIWQNNFSPNLERIYITRLICNDVTANWFGLIGCIFRFLLIRSHSKFNAKVVRWTQVYFVIFPLLWLK